MNRKRKEKRKQAGTGTRPFAIGRPKRTRLKTLEQCFSLVHYHSLGLSNRAQELRNAFIADNPEIARRASERAAYLKLHKKKRDEGETDPLAQVKFQAQAAREAFSQATAKQLALAQGLYNNQFDDNDDDDDDGNGTGDSPSTDTLSPSLHPDNSSAPPPPPLPTASSPSTSAPASLPPAVNPNAPPRKRKKKKPCAISCTE